MLILISDAFAPDLPKILSSYGNVTDDMGKLPEATVVLVRSKTKVTKEYIDSAPNLKLVIRGGVGLDNIDLNYAAENGITVHNTAAASSIAVTELAFTLMITLPNHVIKADSTMHAGQWAKKELKRTELYNKILGIIGLGMIGSELAKRATAFGMNVIAYDPFVESSVVATMKPDLKGVLNNSDYVSLHLPLTDETTGLINAEMLKEFKDGAYLINTGRGKTIIEEDVVEALKSGKLAGFGNDVWYSDPPENTPLIDAPNMLMLPHLGASTKENLLRIGDIIESIIRDFVSTD
ncbi:MAG TPA: hydroxyacid dehydrogenase [Candidatus Marinimicrobia bacterium]|jgi:D-3-phosphoglycerate dehydrogenase|nr:hydroxyacid dehydrogenase [Candidatus Neomarinimicrobiota bacterium]HIO41186.1 hydroxyacid dehydrogenase [Candidatus Neomarinimicrobiota bacterium]